MVAYLVAFYVIQSSGLTLANMPVTTWGINALPNDMIAHGNAISNTGRQVGGAVTIKELCGAGQRLVLRKK